MADEEFDFEAELALLDVGATGSMLRTGCVRPTVLAFTQAAGVEAVALDWADEASVAAAFEEARRHLRVLDPVAYALVAHLVRTGKTLSYVLPGARPTANDFLSVAMFARDGHGRGLLYPIRRIDGQVSFGMPTISDADATDWCPLGDVWGNPFCAGDVVRFAPRDRAVEPGTPLWQSIVELTRLRIHEDQANAAEYMGFLDDLRNGVFAVFGRPPDDPERVYLRPRTPFNPLGTLNVAASRLVLVEGAGAEAGRADAS